MAKNRITIITVNKNDAPGLARTIANVQSQSRQVFEHLIVDGASSDRSLEAIRAHAANDYVSWVSEPDRGVYDAMNKGLTLAKGDYVLFLNAGDVLHDERTHERLDDELRTDDEIVVGDAVIAAAFDGRELRSHQRCTPESLAGVSNICHQAVLFKRACHLKAQYDTRFRICADFDVLLRLWNSGMRFRKSDIIVSIFFIGGLSSSHRHSVRMFSEIHKIRLLNGTAGLSPFGILRFYLAVSGSLAKGALRRSLGFRYYRLKTLLRIPL